MNLCQRDGASCGACCGPYNRRDPSREAIRAELLRRTRRLRGIEPTPGAFGDAADELAREAPEPLFPSVRVCPLLGFLDESHERVGCLAHPAVTGGVDLRDAGVYDARICATFQCPSHAWMSEEEAALVEAAAGDHHLYGLVVTDVPFLRAALEAVAGLSGGRVELRHLRSARFRRALRDLLGLKEELAPGSKGLFGAFTPGPDGEPRPRRIEYATLGRGVSRYDAILTCVGADPLSGNDLDELEEEVRGRLDACARTFPLGEIGQ